MSKPPLPKSVRILGSRAQVRAVKVPLRDSDNRELLGSCNMDVHKINVLVSDESDLTTQQQTLLHEVMHGIIAEAGLRFMFEGDQQEHVVNALSSQLLAFMKENRQAMAYLLGRYWL